MYWMRFYQIMNNYFWKKGRLIMAGYIMTIGEDGNSDFLVQMSALQLKLYKKEKSMCKCINDGVYATRISEKSNAKIATRADYFGMRQGDNIYFFFNRTIYGVGELVAIENECTFYNESSNPLYDIEKVSDYPYLCIFKPSPYFFKNVVDMDDVLMSNPEAFKKLRFFHQRSFIQLDDVENAALKSYIIKNNEDCLEKYDIHKHYPCDNIKTIHKLIEDKYISNKEMYMLNSIKAFEEGCNIKKYPLMIKSEYYVEGMILEYVKKDNGLLGYYDFMSRQYVASPNKPAEYAEFMDMFGYKYVKGYKNDGIISKYSIIEVKSGEITEDAILQIMKYVDWVCKTFSHNDYSMIEAYLVGYNIKDGLLENNKELYTRNYIKSSKHNGNRGVDVETGIWQEVKYIPYVEIYKEMKQKSVL